MKNIFSRKIAVLLCVIIFSFQAKAQIRSDFDRKMNLPQKPFRVIGNIYYVGASDVASYLITTPTGHILIDSGFEETVPMIVANVKKLGFDLKNVKILLNNHAHYDHAGGMATLKSKTGAKLLAVREQANVLERGGKRDFAYGDALSFKPVKVDEIIRPGRKIRLGSVRLKTIFTPGHTKGATTWTMMIKENGKNLRVVFQSSMSVLPKYNLVNNPLYPSHARDFKGTFVKLKRLKPDVFLGSHAQFFKMKMKLKIWEQDRSKNPFIDPQGYREFIIRSEKAFLKKLATQKN